ncbi:hypothetical protein [Cupriavidus sp. IDO]|uniref:hypothetical protein n=1 Tax=Cupriavidus sp. IDO TaxID=1539142 RepID=UPI0012698B27|nr:hypothetical protein [Cupriavidus sp. IDO]
MTAITNYTSSGDVFADSELTPEQLVRVLGHLGYIYDLQIPEEVEAARAKLHEILSSETNDDGKLLEALAAGASPVEDTPSMLASPVSLAARNLSPYRPRKKEQKDPFVGDWPIGSEAFEKSIEAGDSSPEREHWTPPGSGSYARIVKKHDEALESFIDPAMWERYYTKRVSNKDYSSFFAAALEKLPSHKWSLLKWPFGAADEPINTHTMDLSDASGIVELTQGSKKWFVLFAVHDKSVEAVVKAPQGYQSKKIAIVRTALGQPSKFSNEMTVALDGKVEVTRQVLEALQSNFSPSDLSFEEVKSMIHASD